MKHSSRSTPLTNTQSLVFPIASTGQGAFWSDADPEDGGVVDFIGAGTVLTPIRSRLTIPGGGNQQIE